ncbi:unnamed protein product [Microthlaspi erraticum]|uniref:Wall-associated receptor kinase galacturonan-binding domain-containing protein n=1 Tax=Microthlaspi erraticum TaxID=1685480 RepID=A0A6D2IGY4_9BRAS|nr:unnamed protein product [Microthlaspi erraticum]
MVSHGLFLILVMIAIVGSTNIVNARCKGTCDRLTLPYPFGFSDGCPIRLNCSMSGLPMIGDFSVKNLTVDSIFVALTHNCNRTIEDMKPLFGELYAPSLENAFLMENCTRRPTDGCSIKPTFLESQLQMKSCETKGNIRCFSLDKNTTKFFTMEDLRQSSCRLLFSSLTFESVALNAGVAVEFERVRLGWWLKGDCREENCSEKNAVCSQVVTPDGSSGHRCSCPESYEGDGFISSCRKGQCGLTSNRSCSDVEDEDTGLDMVGFYWSLTMTYVIVCTGFLVLLCFESPPRQAWFSLVDNFIHLVKRTLRYA